MPAIALVVARFRERPGWRWSGALHSAREGVCLRAAGGSGACTQDGPRGASASPGRRPARAVGRPLLRDLRPAAV